jgi:hypothetical protein
VFLNETPDYIVLDIFGWLDATDESFIGLGPLDARDYDFSEICLGFDDFGVKSDYYID